MINLANGSWLCMHGQFTSTCTCLLLCSYSTQIHLPNLLSILQLKISRDHAAHTISSYDGKLRFDFVKLSCDAYSYRMARIPVVCTPHWHLCCPRSHHRWFPKCRWYTPPLDHEILNHLHPIRCKIGNTCVSGITKLFSVSGPRG